MIVRFICDCCDEVFDELETQDELEDEELSALTGYRIDSIMRDSDRSSEIYVLSTCENCMRDLITDDGTGEFSFMRPVIN